jgi:multidrug efflux pump subunit AcrA (membrane-fusion protein)
LLEIVPADVPLVIEALLGNDDAGRVQPGQEAVIKIDSFNYTRFGTLRGRVMRVSADAVGGAGEPLRFVAQVELRPGSVGERVGPGPLRPGMSGQVEFQLGRRRAMDYVLGPLRRVVDESAREP